MSSKSKSVAICLAIFGLNDLYLGNVKRFFLKMLVGLFTIGFGIVVWQIIDIINLVTGKTNCDASGIPLV